MGSPLIVGIERKGSFEVFDRGLPVADRVLETRFFSRKVLQLIRIGHLRSRLQAGFALAEEGVTEIVMSLAAERFVPLDKSITISLGGAFEVTEAVGCRADAHVKPGPVIVGETLGQGAFIGFDGGGKIPRLIGFVTGPDAVAGRDWSGREEETTAKNGQTCGESFYQGRIQRATRRGLQPEKRQKVGEHEKCDSGTERPHEPLNGAEPSLALFAGTRQALPDLLDDAGEGRLPPEVHVGPAP